MPSERTIEFEGQRIWTEALGNPEGVPVLLISGAGAHAHFWSDTFCHTFLQNGFYVIRYDHRDVGLSHPSSEEYDLMRLTKDAIEILNAYYLRAAHIVGHSMGGYIAQLLAADYPERVLSITCISASPVGETPALQKPHTPEERDLLHVTWRAMIRNRPTKDFDESLEGFMGVWERLNGLFPLDEGLAKNYTREMYTRSRYAAGVHEKHMKAMQKMAKTLKERKDIFDKIGVPTLILHGEEDYLAPPARGGGALAEVLPSAQFHLVPKMGHMLFNYELEKIVSQEIVSFLQSVES